MTLNPQNRVFWCFFAIFGCEAHVKTIALKWLEIDKDNLQTGTAKTIACLMSSAHITCQYFRMDGLRTDGRSGDFILCPMLCIALYRQLIMHVLGVSGDERLTASSSPGGSSVVLELSCTDARQGLLDVRGAEWIGVKTDDTVSTAAVYNASIDNQTLTLVKQFCDGLYDLSVVVFSASRQYSSWPGALSPSLSPSGWFRSLG